MADDAPAAAAASDVDTERRLTRLEQAVKDFRPKTKDVWDRLQAIGPLISGVLVAFVGYLFTGSVNNAIQRQQLQPSNAKEMRELIVQLDSGTADDEQRFTPPAAGAAPSVPSRTALADGVQLQLRGMLAAMTPGATVDDRLHALELFELAATVLPHDANARNLVAMMQLSLALDSGRPEFSPRQAASALLQALGADPGNARLLANLKSAYQALLSPPAASAVALTEDERRSFSEQLAALKQIR